jgi:hypothetical protein
MVPYGWEPQRLATVWFHTVGQILVGRFRYMIFRYAFFMQRPVAGQCLLQANLFA